MNPDEFKVAFINWIESIKNLMPNEVVSIDGKTLRGSQNRRNGQAAIHMISAWASEMSHKSAWSQYILNAFALDEYFLMIANYF